MRKVSKTILSGSFILIILFFFITIMLTAAMKGIGAVKSGKTPINWAERYPFKETEITAEPQQETGDNLLVLALDAVKKYENKVRGFESGYERYWTTMLVGYEKAAEASKTYEKALGWDISPLGQENSVYDLSDGYFASLQQPNDQTDIGANISNFMKYCRKNGAEPYFVLAPSKIDKYGEPDINEILDYTNQNGDKLLEILKENNEEYIDLREIIRASGKNYRSLFYRTDHHWKAETTLWMTKEFLCRMNEYPCFPELDNGDIAGIFDDGEWKFDLYPSWFLGSQGRKVTLAQADPDDFTLFYPKKDVSFHVEIPEEGINVTGGYLTTYDDSQLIKNYYVTSPYDGLSYGVQPYIHIQNADAPSSKKVLFIHDSFGNPCIPELAMISQDVYALDLRKFTGSVETFIEKEKPDIVVIMYSCVSLNDTDVNNSSHTSKYDFR